jgi:hypothetical protein
MKGGKFNQAINKKSIILLSAKEGLYQMVQQTKL